MNQDLLDSAEQLACGLLWGAGVVTVNFEKPFTLVSGMKSPIYINCRNVLNYPNTRPACRSS
jgi:orotate phosphoribosyltransferase